MQQNTNDVEAVYAAAKAFTSYKELYQGKKFVVVLNNSPPPNRREGAEHDDLVLLRLASHLPMCNRIENCFSVLKTRVKDHLTFCSHEMTL